MTIHLNKVNGFGGGEGGGGGDGKFPTIVTDSGSSLPVDLSGYQVGDTFLNTSDKKIYKAGAGYIKNTSTDYNITIDVDFNTGVGSGFAQNKYCLRNISGGIWTSSRNYYVKFKYTVEEETPIFALYSYGSYFYANFIIRNKKLYYVFYKNTNVTFSQILTTNISPNIEYVLKVEKKSGDYNCYVSLYNADNILLEETSFDGNQISSYNSYDQFQIGQGYYIKDEEQYGQYHYGNSLLVSLSESAYNFVVYDSNLNWDNGTSLTDKTEYADKTNGILYLYQDTELIQIPLIDLSNYKLKAETITISTASVTVSEIKANTNYVFSNNAITDITLSGCETSFEETTIEFTTGSTAPTLTDNSGITWVDGSAPTLNTNKSYLIVIFNKLGFVKEY